MVLFDTSDTKADHGYLAVLKTTGAMIGWTIEKDVKDLYRRQRSKETVDIEKVDIDFLIEKILGGSYSDDGIWSISEDKLSYQIVKDLVFDEEGDILVAITNKEKRELKYGEESIQDNIPQLRQIIIDMIADSSMMLSDEDMWLEEYLAKSTGFLADFFHENRIGDNGCLESVVSTYRLFLYMNSITILGENIRNPDIDDILLPF